MFTLQKNFFDLCFVKPVWMILPQTGIFIAVKLIHLFITLGWSLSLDVINENKVLPLMDVIHSIDIHNEV